MAAHRMAFEVQLGYVPIYSKSRLHWMGRVSGQDPSEVEFGGGVHVEMVDGIQWEATQ